MKKPPPREPLDGRTDALLRSDVRLLGRILGEVIAEQEGTALLALEERIRHLAIDRRRGPVTERRTAERRLASSLSALAESKVEPILRAFSHYFELVNLAEQHHRIRRARAHAASLSDPPQRGSLRAVLEEARRNGVSTEACREAISKLEVTLTFTAHPTQAARRTVLEKLYRVAHLLETRDRTALLPSEADALERDLHEVITSLWQTDALRRERPTVGDEVKNVLWYLEEILHGATARHAAALAESFEQVYGEPLGFVPSPVRLHSWVGGDMDGHPLVTSEVLEGAVLAYHERGVAHLLREVRALGRTLSQSERYVTPPARLLESLEEDAREMPEVAAAQGPRTEGEPWRRKLRFIEARLTSLQTGRSGVAPVRPERRTEGPESKGQRTVRDRERTSDAADHGTTGSLSLRLRAPRYAQAERRSPAEALASDLMLIAETLREAGGPHSGASRAEALAAQVRAHGSFSAELEMRVTAEDARAAWEAVQAGGPSVHEGLEPAAARVIDSLRRIAGLQERLGAGACRTLILSMTHSAEDVLATFRLVRALGLWDEATGSARMDVVPLFETRDALESSASIFRALLSDADYRRHLEGRGVQEILLGYSDSAKEVGLLAASEGLLRAQTELPDLARKAGVALRLFHGRGESVARGGGPAQQAILALPEGSVNGRYKATEQGEALDHKYARPELADRTLALITGGVLLHTLGLSPKPAARDEPIFREAYARMAETGRKRYRALVWDEPRFVEFFRAVTPIEEISALPAGSRPTKRRKGGLEAMRAIPWSFAWTQNRAILPAWYGVGSALEAEAARPGGLGLLRRMYRTWPWFRAMLDNVEMVLAKSDLEIAGRYAQLAPAAFRSLWKEVREEHARTVGWLLKVTSRRALLRDNPTLARSIALRNPYVDPLSYLQVALLRRKRAGAPVERELLLTVNGIAAGMRNTG